MSTSSLVNKSENFLDAEEQYLVVIASCICKKLDPKKEPILSSVVERYPYANIYAGDTKHKPGSIQIVGDGLKNRYIIIVFSQIYPGSMDYPRDNKRQRVEWFGMALDKIAEIENLKSVAFPTQIAKDGGGNWSQYYMLISDFADTLDLKCKIPVVIYHNAINDQKPEVQTQISLLNCINLESSVSLSNILFLDDPKLKVKVEKDHLTLNKKKKNKKIKMNTEKLKVPKKQEEESNDMASLIIDDQSNLNLQDNQQDEEEVKIKLKSQKPKLKPFEPTDINKDWHGLLTEPNVDESWSNFFQHPELQKKLSVTHKLLFKEIETHGAKERILPPFDNIFKAFQLCTYTDLKVVILGQDPYPNRDHAMGLSFSVPSKCSSIPSSLQNIFKEIKNEYDDEYTIPKHGNLEKWAQQGILLLNSALTIRSSAKNSHQIFWRSTTDLIIELISKLAERSIIFILWGGDAKKKKKLIDTKKHLVLESAHPSGLSAHRGFFKNNHFKTCNKKLISMGLDAIDWQT